MKLQWSLLISSALLAAGPLWAGDELSVKDWGKQVKAALKEGDAKQFQALTDFAKNEKTLLKRQDAPDRQSLKKARDQFEKGQFEPALETYGQVDKSSDFWLEATEEKGWTYHRGKAYEKSLAQTKTLLTEPFLSVIGSEPFFLQALTQLKICDYKGILETNKLFKETQRARLLEIQNLSKSGTSLAVSDMIQKTATFPMTIEDGGESAKLLPRLFYRDQKLQAALLRMKLAEALEGQAEYAEKLNEAYGKTLTEYKQAAVVAKSVVQERLKALALTENEENFKIVQKLNLIEVETIERIHADQELDRKSFTKGQFKQASVDQLVFPDDGLPWMDELDKYQVKVNSCPQDLRRKM